MKINVPYNKQKTEYTCGPSSLKMLFKFFGENISENRISKQTKTKQSGTSHKNLINTARKHNFYCYVHENSSIHQIKHFIDKNLPVIVNYIEPFDNEGHYSVIIGYDKTKIILNDPWDGKNFKLPFVEFKGRWFDKHKNYI